MRLTFCGVRGSTPAPGTEFVRYGGHTSCVAVAHDGAAAPTLILDAGTGERTLSCGDRQVLQRARDGRGERLQLRRQP